MKEQRRRTEEFAKEMKLKTAAMETLMEEKDRHNQTPHVVIEEMTEKKGREIILIKRNVEIGKCALLRKISQMQEEISSLQEHRTPPTESDTKDDEQNEEKNTRATVMLDWRLYMRRKNIYLACEESRA